MASEPTITVDDEPAGSRYVIRLDGEEAGFAQYHEFDGGLDFVHTVIDEAYEGQGLGGRLASGALDDVRRRGLHARTTCSFVASYVGRHPEYLDLIA